MKFVRMIALVLLLAVAMVAAAQELTQTSTFGSVTVSYPEGFFARELAPNTVGVADPTDAYGVVLFAGDAIEAFGFPAASTVESVLALSDPTFVEITSDVTPVSLPNGDGGMADASFPDMGSGVVIVIEGESGLIIGYAAGERPADFDATALAIVGSVIFEPEVAQVEPTSTPDKGGESTDEPDTTDTTELDGETCPIAVEDLPKNTVQFCLGVEMVLPENWSLIDGTEEVDNFASVTRGSFSVNLSTSVNEVSQYYNPDMYATDVVTFTADVAGHDTYDAAEHIVTVLEEEGRKVSVYDPSAYVDLTEDDVYQVTYLVTLNNDIFVVHTFTWVPSLSDDAEEIAGEIEEVALSTTLADFYDGVPAFIEVDGETIFVFEATAFDSSYMFTVEDEAEFLATCPAEMSGDESTVWGTDVYTDDSSVCLAAAHAGAITLADGGTVKVTMLPGEESYTGSTRNGVTTQDYGTWSGSFSIEAFELP